MFALFCRKITAGHIDVHPVDNAIVVHYEAEALVLGEGGEVLAGRRKLGEKM